jgi:DNA-binding response OmpR family regulator
MKTGTPAMTMQKILIIEDEREMVRGLRDVLEFEGYEVIAAEKGRDGLSAAAQQSPDCIILDLMLPDINGYVVCQQIRQAQIRVPIIMLTARAQEYDKIRGLDVGADDYLTKPFSVGELLARVKAVLRRSTEYAQEVDVVQVGNCEVDVRHFKVRRGRKEHALSHYEVEIFKLLHASIDQPVSRDTILDRVWGTSNYPYNRTVDNFIVKLRKKIEDDYRNPKHILTIYGVGYKLSP